MEEATSVTMIVTCRTPGCPVEDVSYTCEMYGPPFNAQCAQCGQHVTDIVAA